MDGEAVALPPARMARWRGMGTDGRYNGWETPEEMEKDERRKQGVARLMRLVMPERAAKHGDMLEEAMAPWENELLAPPIDDQIRELMRAMSRKELQDAEVRRMILLNTTLFRSWYREWSRIDEEVLAEAERRHEHEQCLKHFGIDLSDPEAAPPPITDAFRERMRAFVRAEMPVDEVDAIAGLKRRFPSVESLFREIERQEEEGGLRVEEDTP